MAIITTTTMITVMTTITVRAVAVLAVAAAATKTDYPYQGHLRVALSFGGHPRTGIAGSG
jgi:hypothetical protein